MDYETINGIRNGNLHGGDSTYRVWRIFHGSSDRGPDEQQSQTEKESPEESNSL